MKAQLEKELKDLAVEVLSMQNQNINDLKHKAAEIYERLCVLAYTEKEALANNAATHTETTTEKEFTAIDEVTDFVTSLTEETDEILSNNNLTNIEAAPERETSTISESKPISEIIQQIIPENNTSIELTASLNEPQLTNKETPEVVEKHDTDTTEIPQELNYDKAPEAITEQTNIEVNNSPELLHELEALTAGFDLPEFDPVDTPLEENTTHTTPDSSTYTEPTTAAPLTKVNEAVIAQQKSSLNDKLKKSIQIGLNDRIGFIKHLFNGNQDDYTRVLSQLNTFETNTEALHFINQMVKPEYNNWENKEAFETRFLEVVFRKFDTL